MALRTTRQRSAHARTQRIPRMLWKYGPPGAIAILETLELKVTRPNEFNDPFEWSAGIVGSVTADDVARCYADPEWVARFDPSGLGVDDPHDRDAAYAELARVFTETSQEIMAEELARISAKRGIVCLSANPASILMWAHYADNHRGIAIGIDHRKLGHMPLFPVSYGHRRVLFDARTPLRLHPNVRSFEIFTRKSEVWSYEREYRMVWPFTETIPRQIAGRDAFVIPLAPEAIAEVRLGARATEALERQVLDVIERHGAPTRVRRATRHPRQYRLLFQDAVSS